MVTNGSRWLREPPQHPPVEEIDLLKVFACLSDPIRFEIVLGLAAADAATPDVRCSEFGRLAGKTVLAYHFAVLRSSGLVWTTLDGNRRYMRLRREDLDRRFPGLFGAIMRSAASGRGSSQRPS